MVPEDAIEPVRDLPDADALPDAGDAPLDQAVVIKLNGGLGTSMGMSRAKSLLRSRTACRSSTSSRARCWRCARRAARGSRSC